MKNKLRYAVITGDIVDSSRLTSTERELVLDFIKKIFKNIEKEEGKFKEINDNYVITRGDSFQIVVKDFRMTLKYSILLRAGLKALINKDLLELCDTRISIGVGNISYWGDSISESDGDAFRYSGRAFDKFKNKERLRIKTDEEELDEELNVYLKLLDSIISDWTNSRAQIIYEKILEPKQKSIANKLDISASVVSRRLNSAHWNSVETLLNRYEKILSK